MKKVTIHTDGACSGNPGPGGWGAVLQYSAKQKQISGSAQDTTNNRMELQAVIESLKLLKEPCEVDLYTDSKYVLEGITKWIEGWIKNNWKNSQKKPVKNEDLWKELHFEVKRHQINWHWVKGHDGDEFNEIADKLAVDAIER